MGSITKQKPRLAAYLGGNSVCFGLDPSTRDYITSFEGYT